MENLARIIFYIPVLLYIVLFLSYKRISKTTLKIFFVSLPSYFFIYKLFNFRHWQQFDLFIIYLIGLALSAILLSVYIWHIYKSK